ncbi:unnamed protein product, partial [Dovyalis caffra]
DPFQGIHSSHPRHVRSDVMSSPRLRNPLSERSGCGSRQIGYVCYGLLLRAKPRRVV